MKKMSTFQLVIVSVFGVSVLVALLIFALFPPKGKEEEVDYGTVTVWGTLPKTTVSTALSDLDVKIKINYVQKSPATLQSEIYRALLSNKTPDVVIFPQGEYLNYRMFLKVFPAEYLPERTFMNTFIEQAEMFIGKDGVYALPLAVDPMVMYWNRNTFSSSNVSTVPDEWDDFRLLVPKMAMVGSDTEITRVALPFGEYVNVTHVKDIVSMLMMQAGAPVVKADHGDLTVDVNTPIDSVYPGATALNFYMEFSNQSLPTYNWNRTLPSSKEMFIAGDSAVYFGYASEIPEIEKTNPHLNFDVAMVPQRRGTKTRLTYGDMIGVGVIGMSKNTFGAYKTAEILSGLYGDTAVASKLSEGLKLPPAHRVLLEKVPNDIRMSVFYEAANVSKSWPDPSSTDTDRVFETAIEGILSNRFKTDSAIVTLQKQLEQIISEYQKNNPMDIEED